MADLQRTPEWYAARAGKLTASRFGEVLGTRNARRAYMHEVVFERAARMAKHEVTSKSMAWGTELEPFAISQYELLTGHLVAPAPFMVHAVYDFIGGSPDGLVARDGLIELKSPHDEAVHVQTWLEGMPDEHRPQVQGNLAVTGRRWADFLSYDPRQAPELRLYVERVVRDEAYIANLMGALRLFNTEAEAMLADLLRRAA